MTVRVRRTRAALLVALLAVTAVLLVQAADARLGAEPARAEAEPRGALPTMTVSGTSGPGDAAAVVPPVDRCARTGERMVLVDLSEQHLRLCRGGVTVGESPITSGSDEHPTPTGRWNVYAKQTDRWLSGEGYSRLVDHWMPFFRGYGFHDSAWQTIPYGSDQVHEDGSHGCVHVPGPMMKRLYRWADVGTAVRIVR